MSQIKRITLVSMSNGQSGIIYAIRGGRGMTTRLEALGVRIGAEIIKKSSLMRGGPVIIAVGNTEIAIGYGMASKIIVEVNEL